ncbi:MAG: hypothetical protein OEY97_02990, partial [Nitrospirota bacterium]|nr:hypothetical protein [Nitrospirota bacterium]
MEVRMEGPEQKGGSGGEQDRRPLTKKEFRELSPSAAVVLAARCAMRVLPLVWDRELFAAGDGWDTHVRAIEAATLVAAWGPLRIIAYAAKADAAKADARADAADA